MHASAFTHILSLQILICMWVLCSGKLGSAFLNKRKLFWLHLNSNHLTDFFASDKSLHK